MRRHSAKRPTLDCPRCRGPIDYDPATGKNTCAECGWPDGTPRFNWELVLGGVLIFVALVALHWAFFFLTLGQSQVAFGIFIASLLWVVVGYGAYVMWSGEARIMYQRGFFGLTPNKYITLKGWVAQLYGFVYVLMGGAGLAWLYYAAFTRTLNF